MGKVDQGVFTHWLLSYYRGRAAHLHRLRRDRQAGARPAARRRSGRPRRRPARRSASTGRAARSTSAAVGRVACRCVKHGTLCREITGRDVAVTGDDRQTAPETCASTCPIARRCSPIPTGGRAAVRATSWPTPSRWINENERLVLGADSADPRTVSIAIVTGSGGLIGSESVAFLVEQGYRVIGLDNDMRAQFFGPTATTAPTTERLAGSYDMFTALDLDIRDARRRRPRVFAAATPPTSSSIVHTAAQPSHDWAASDPQTDFTVNANGTLNLLQAARDHTPDATFIFTSTNKVYGDRPNFLPLVRSSRRASSCPSRPPLVRRHRPRRCRSTSARTRSSGVSKVAADLMVQEYGRYFDMPTVCFRGGCLTGPQHAGAQLHGFLAYLMRCTVDRRPVHDLRLRRQAGARQHPRPRRRARVPGLPREPAAGGGLQPRRRAREQRARCSRRSRCASGSPDAS